MGPKNAPAAVKGTILCLHGFAQNGSTFSAKASGIRKALKKVGYHTVFIDGPMCLTSADLPFDASSLDADTVNDFKGWWLVTDDYDVNPALESIKKSYEEFGPFVGIMGFSQGAGLTAVALNNYDEIIGKEGASKELKFGIFYSAFKLIPEKYQRFYEPRNLSIPTMHIMGELDTLVSNERSQTLADIFEKPFILKHPGGHFVPNTKDLLKKEVDWVQSIMEPKEEKEEEKVDEEDELKKLTAEMDKLGTV